MPVGVTEGHTKRSLLLQLQLVLADAPSSPSAILLLVLLEPDCSSNMQSALMYINSPTRPIQHLLHGRKLRIPKSFRVAMCLGTAESLAVWAALKCLRDVGLGFCSATVQEVKGYNSSKGPVQEGIIFSSHAVDEEGNPLFSSSSIHPVSTSTTSQVKT